MLLPNVFSSLKQCFAERAASRSVVALHFSRLTMLGHVFVSHVRSQSDVFGGLFFFLSESALGFERKNIAEHAATVNRDD